MKEKTTQQECYQSIFALFLNARMPDEILNAYIEQPDFGENYERVCAFVLNNMRGEIFDWATGIGIIESVELMYKSALENGNIEPEDKK